MLSLFFDKGNINGLTIPCSIEESRFFCYNKRIMGILNTHKQLLLILHWYWVEEPIRIIRGYAAYARALLEVVPFVFLVFTLISPWKNIHEKAPAHGFDLNLWFERLVMNVFSRVVGAVMRIFTLALGIVAQVALLAFSLVYLSAWLMYPFLAAYGVLFIFATIF
jgi:hypothetical protein